MERRRSSTKRSSKKKKPSSLLQLQAVVEQEHVEVSSVDQGQQRVQRWSRKPANEMSTLTKQSLDLIAKKYESDNVVPTSRKEFPLEDCLHSSIGVTYFSQFLASQRHHHHRSCLHCWLNVQDFLQEPEMTKASFVYESHVRKYDPEREPGRTASTDSTRSSNMESRDKLSHRGSGTKESSKRSCRVKLNDEFQKRIEKTYCDYKTQMDAGLSELAVACAAGREAAGTAARGTDAKEAAGTEAAVTEAFNNSLNELCIEMMVTLSSVYFKNNDKTGEQTDESFEGSTQYQQLRRQQALNEGRKVRMAARAKAKTAERERECGFVVHEGKQHLVDIIASPVGNAFFHHHCSREFSTENLEFYLGSEYLRREWENATKKLKLEMKEEVSTKIFESALELITDYVAEGAEYQININAENRVAIIKATDVLGHCKEDSATDVQPHHRRRNDPITSKDVKEALAETPGMLGEAETDAVDNVVSSFTVAKTEVLELMFKDSFQRFKGPDGKPTKEYTLCLDQMDLFVRSGGGGAHARGT